MNQVFGTHEEQLGQVAQPPIWFERIAAANVEADVVLLTKEYLASWSAQELAGLEEDCRPGRINGADHIAELAYRLARERTTFSGSIADTLLLDRMTDFFIQAAARISMLAHMSRVRPETVKAIFQNTQ